jgi:hypothetical protein
MSPTEQFPQHRISYGIEELPGLTGIPRTKIFEDARAGKFAVRKHGRTSIVEHDEAVRYVKSLPVKGARVVKESAANKVQKIATA